MNHVARFKVLYLSLFVIIASSVAGELTAMKELTKEQLAAVTWVVWAILVCNIVVNAGTNIISALSVPPPPAVPKVAAPVVVPPAAPESPVNAA